MEKTIHGLPPVKRFRYLQKENQEPESGVVSPPKLPAKKRKESRDPLPFCSYISTSYCLPAKKRIWAPPIQSDFTPHKPLSPFDLNIEYNPLSDSEPESITTTNSTLQTVPITDPLASAEEDEQEVDDDNDDDGILCVVCESTDGDPSDPIVICDGCDLMVHKNCYGHPLTNGVPEGDWFCAKCLASQSSNEKGVFNCCLCPVTGGALKPTSDGRWAHVVCAVYVPEVFFKDPEGREGIDCSRVPLRRWEKKCYVCGCKNGCVIECSEQKCGLGFHVTCGLKEELCIEYIQGKKNGDIVAGFCKKHTDLWAKQQQTGKFKIVATDEHKN